jgi:mutator protein MutT
VEQRTEVVVAAMIVDDEGRILIAERPEGKFMAGWWEFPGGKLEFGERPEEGLAREVREELGIDVEVGDPFHVVNVSRTPETAVCVIFYWCRWTGGELQLLDAGDVAWVTVEDFDRIRFLESNRTVVEKLWKKWSVVSGQWSVEEGSVD